MMETTPTPIASRWAVWGWCFYDWANSAFPTVVLTFVFSTYFAKAVAPNPEVGVAQWGWMMAISGLAIALFSPILGIMADRLGRRTVWVGGFTGLMCVATAGLWFVTPEPASTWLCLVLVGVATVGFEVATVFYNALLPGLVAPQRLGRISGWAWGLGYVGGLVCLVLVLFGLVKADPPPLGLNPADAEPVRAAALLVAVWVAVFSLPLLVWLRDPPKPAPPTMVGPLRQVTRDFVAAVRAWPRAARIGRFLLARMLYTDGLNTLFAFGGVYAAGTFGLSLADVMTFGIAMNVTAGLGAVVFGWLDDRSGPKRVILVSLAAMMGLGTALVMVESVAWFWGLGLALGVFVGPVQAASRTFVARIAPPQDVATCFGLFALSGKITAFLGPAVLAMATTAFASQRAGMATILGFLGVGGLLLLTVPKPGTMNRCP